MITIIRRMAFVATTLVASGAAAQSVSDFKDAAGASGCRLIPYSSERSGCEAKGGKVTEYCKTKTWSCDGLDPEGIEKNIENVKKKIEDLKRDRAALASKKSSAKEDSEKRDLERRISDMEKEIEKLEKLIGDWQRKLDDEKKAISVRLSIGKQCREHRQEVAKIFSDAKSKLKSESDPEIKPHAQRSVDKIEAEESGHRTAINLVTQGIDKCERMR